MKFRSAATIAILTAAVAGSQALSAGSRDALAHAAVMAGDGTSAGTATIRLRRGQPVLELALTGIPAGVHGIHIHAVGRCDGPGAAFTAAGGHLNPAGVKHGTRNPAGHHLGDLPNVTANRSGRVNARIPLGGSAEQWTASLFDADGSAIVVHAGPDDYMTDPAGNSGARIACGVLTRG